MTLASDPSLAAAVAALYEAANRRVDPIGGILLAVSGGADSLALLLAAAVFRKSLGAASPDIRVATVDHGLRADSVAEAAFVATIAARCDLPHETLRWNGWDGTGNLSGKARDARYGLLLDYARANDLGLVLVAHHRDDDIETSLIRKTNGADLLGRAAMRRLRSLAPDVILGRPFLDLPRHRLASAVRAEGVSPVDDPSNRDPRYHRARIRLALVGDAGLSESAMRDLSRAKQWRQRGEEALATFIEDLEARGHLSFVRDGTVVLARSTFAGISERCAVQLLSRAVVAASGRALPPARAAVHDIVKSMGKRETTTTGARSLAGALVSIGESEVTLIRELGRDGISALPLGNVMPLRSGSAAGMAFPIVFDGRFVVDAGPWVSLAGAQLVALEAFGLGGRHMRSLPVVVDKVGQPLAAIGPAAARLGPWVAPLEFRLLTPHLFKHDLPFARRQTPSSP